MGSQGKAGYRFFLLVLVAIVGFFGYLVIREQRSIANDTQSSALPEVLASDPTRGSGNAVTIIEFGDFQCSFCRSSQTALSVVLAKYAHQVRHVWKDFPLAGQHPEARNAAEAARCAQDQGKFWEMHDQLFAHQDELGSQIYRTLAQSIGVNLESFDQCMLSGGGLDRIQASTDAGLQAGVDGTPYYFVNSIIINQVPTQDVLERAILQALNS